MIDAYDRRRFLKTTLFATMSASALQACGGTATSNASANSNAPAPVSAAQLNRALELLDPLISNLQQSSGIPGIAVAVVQGPKTVFAKGYGVAKAGTQQTVDADTVFQLASVSKSVGATVVATQVGNGNVSWNTPIQRLLPWFALSDPAITRKVTIGDLYAHRSGLPDHVGDQLEDLAYDQKTILQRLRYMPLDGYGTKYAYTNIGLTAAAVGVATAAGTDWASLSDKTIYQPLGMSRTSSRYADFLARPNHAVGHVPVNGAFEPSQLQRDADAQSPAGGVSSSVSDMAKWLSMVLGRGQIAGAQVIPEAALMPALSQQTLTRAAGDGRPAGYYGFGFNVGTTAGGDLPMVNHSGAFLLGAATFFLIVPSMNIGIVVLTNAWPVGVAEAIGFQFLDYVQFGAAQKDWAALLAPVFAGMTAPGGSLAGESPPASPAPARTLAAYAGTYGNNEYYGPMQVTVQNGALVLSLGPASTSFVCTHWDGDTFAIHPDGENAPPGSVYKVTFAGTPVKQVTAEFFHDGGLDVFTR